MLIGQPADRPRRSPNHQTSQDDQKPLILAIGLTLVALLNLMPSTFL
ncbi:hypothetical protein [Nostoc sp.]